MSDAAAAEALIGLQNAITRAKHVLAAYFPDGQRTMLQLKALDNEVLQGIELLLPYGMSAMPAGSTADYLVFQVNNTRDHKVALAGDDPACRIAGLVPGEFGFSDNQGQKVVFKRGGLFLDTSVPNLPITINAGSAAVTVTTTGAVDLNSPAVLLGGTSGGKKIVLDGDPVVGGGGGTVQASSTHSKAI